MGPSGMTAAPRGDRPGSLEEVYESCTPLLLSAIGRLIRRGYRLDPSMGLDYVHDFYLEELPGLFKRYDPDLGRFSTYLYAAFLQYARPRIVRSMRWEGMLADLDHYPAASRPEELEFSDRLTESAATAFAALPKAPRNVLKARIVDGLSERETARRLGLSRYFVRQHTAEALGRLAIAIGEDARIPEDVRPLAVRLWRDERTLMEAASEMGWSRPQALARFHELLDRIASVLGQQVE